MSAIRESAQLGIDEDTYGIGLGEALDLSVLDAIVILLLPWVLCCPGAGPRKGALLFIGVNLCVPLSISMGLTSITGV